MVNDWVHGTGAELETAYAMVPGSREGSNRPPHPHSQSALTSLEHQFFRAHSLVKPQQPAKVAAGVDRRGSKEILSMSFQHEAVVDVA